MQQGGQFRLFVPLVACLAFLAFLALLAFLVFLVLLLHGRFRLHRRVPLHVWWTTYRPTPIVQKRVRIPWDFIRLRGRGGREKSTCIHSAEHRERAEKEEPRERAKQAKQAKQAEQAESTENTTKRVVRCCTGVALVFLFWRTVRVSGQRGHAFHQVLLQETTQLNGGIVAKICF